MASSKQSVYLAGALCLAALAFTIRLLFVSFQSGDFIGSLNPWFHIMQHEGWHAFSHTIDFANYNLPYLYLLFIGSKLGLSALVTVKSIAIITDFVLAFGIYLVVRHYRPKGLLPIVAAIASLFLPTVLLNGSLWGQCDALYTSLLVFSFWRLQKKAFLSAWIFFALALAFKLQAIFFLPFIGYVWLSAIPTDAKLTLTILRTWLLPIVAAIAVLFVVDIPALFAGQPFSSLLSIYGGQVGSLSGLSAYAGNLYDLLPGGPYLAFVTAGILLTAAIIIALLLFAYAKLKLSPNRPIFVLFAALLLTTMTFFLPQMHERYFFPAEIFTFIAAFLLPWRFFGVVILFQFTSIMAYLPFLFHETPVPMMVLGLLHGIVLLVLFYVTFQPVFKKTETLRA